jgi:hypothetical protein
MLHFAVKRKYGGKNRPMQLPGITCIFGRGKAYAGKPINN